MAIDSGPFERVLHLARHGEPAALTAFLKSTGLRAAIYAVWVGGAPRPVSETAREAVTALDRARRAGAMSRLLARVRGDEVARTVAAFDDPSRVEAALTDLRDALVALHPDSREVLLICDLVQVPVAEAGRVLIAAESVVGQRLGRAREQLRARLQLVRR